MDGLFRDAGNWGNFAHLLGIGVPLGKAFGCVLPGHGERSPSAQARLAENGWLVYVDYHRRSGAGAFTLPEVYAAQVSGTVRKIRGVELALWSWRLAAAAGLVDLPEVRLPEVLGSEGVQRVRRGFADLLRVKAVMHPGAPTTFARSFASGWCGVSEDTVVRAMQAMKRACAVVKVGSTECGHGRTAALWLPGGRGH